MDLARRLAPVGKVRFMMSFYPSHPDAGFTSRAGENIFHLRSEFPLGGSLREAFH